MQRHIDEILRIEQRQRELGGSVRQAVTDYLDQHDLRIRVATRDDSARWPSHCFKAHHGTYYRLMQVRS